MVCFIIKVAFKSFSITSSSHLCANQMTGVGVGVGLGVGARARERNLVLVDRNSNPGQNCRGNDRRHDSIQDMHFK